jgi:hypothetical protein
MRRAVSTLLFLALVSLCAAPGAQADYDPVGAGATAIKLDKGFLALLRTNGVALSAKAPATLRKGTVSFPVSGGKFDPTNDKGTVEHEGGLLLKGDGGTVLLKSLQLKTTRRSSPISLKVGGGQLKLGAARQLLVSREGFGDRVDVKAIRLAGKVATRLDKRLHLGGNLGPGQPFGSAVSKVRPQTITVLGRGVVNLDLDPGFAAKLNELHVAVNPIFPAEHPGAFTLAIFGGKIAPDLSSGRLEAQGGLELLQLGGGQVIWSEPVVDLDAGALSAGVDVEPAPPYAGKVGPLSIAALQLAIASRSASPKKRTVTVADAPLTLDSGTAATFNEVFARPQGKDGVFAPGEALGRLSFTAQAQ